MTKDSRRSGKPDNERAIPVNITLHPQLRVAADKVVSKKAFSSLSDYIQACIRRDAVALGMTEFGLSE